MKDAKRLLTPSQSSAARAALFVGAALFVVGLKLSPARGGAGLLLANFYFSSLALIGLVFIAIQNVSSAGWPALFRRVPEAMTSYLPLGAVLTLLTVLLARGIYPWAAPGAAQALGKASYFSVGWFAARAAVCWLVWLTYSRVLVGSSRAQDAERGEAAPMPLGVSATFLLAFGLTFSLAGVDWLMSLEPRWTSTLYPWFVFAGAFQAGLAGLTALVIVLRRRGFFPEFNENHLHDLGKYLFAFSCFWMYLWFCQYLLIWYTNIPDEAAHYMMRSSPAWSCLFWMNPVVNFIVPFGLLLPASRKRREGFVFFTALLILAGHALDLFMLIEPSQGPGPRLSLALAAAFVAVGAAFLLLLDRGFASAAPEPERDPFIEESRKFAGV